MFSRGYHDQCRAGKGTGTTLVAANFKSRWATHRNKGQRRTPLTRAPLIVCQPQFFDFVEIDFNLATARIGEHHFHRGEGQIGAEQIPRSELQARGDYDDEASRQRAVGPHPAQQYFGSKDLDKALAPADAQAQRVFMQPVRKTPTHLIDAAGLAEHARAALARRTAVGREVDALIAAHPPQGKVPLRAQGSQQWAAENAAVAQPDVPHRHGQTQVLGQHPDQRGDRAAFDIEQGSDQDTGPLPDLPLAAGIEVRRW